MKYVIYLIDGFFLFLGLGGFFAFLQSKHIGLLLSAIIFVASAALSFYLTAWYPLVLGFAILWVLRLLGLDPGYRN